MLILFFTGRGLGEDTDLTRQNPDAATSKGAGGTPKRPCILRVLVAYNRVLKAAHSNKRTKQAAYASREHS